MGKKKRKRSRPPRDDGFVYAHLSWLEIALGHDGFMRGDPDPVILAGLYELAADGAKLVCRGLRRMYVPGPYPASKDGAASMDGSELLSKRLTSDNPIALLVLAMEEDGGSDIRRVYARLERPDFALWNEDHAEPTPLSLREWADAHPDSSHPVEVLTDGQSVREECTDDELVGAAICVYPKRKYSRLAHRLHFRSRDGKNDWTCEVALVNG